MSQSRTLRRQLVDVLDHNGSLRTPAIRAAFLELPREVFVPQIAAEFGLRRVYADDALVTRRLAGHPVSSSSQPTIMALMLEALEVRPGDRVLEIGLGTGYNAAVLATLTGPDGHVVSIDIDPDVVAAADTALRAVGRKVETVPGDGSLGHPDGAPYDRIIVTASTDRIPRAWWDQIVPGGRLVVPLRIGAMQMVVVLVRTGEGFVSTEVIPGGFMPMRPSAEVSSVGGASVTIDVVEEDGTSSGLTVSGPGLSGLTGQARALAIGRLLGAADVYPIRAFPARYVLWQAIMATSADRQIVVYTNGGQKPWAGTRFGIVDPGGALALLAAGEHGVDGRISEIQGYGPAEGLAAELVASADAWSEAGEPDFERLRIAIDYPEAGALVESVAEAPVPVPEGGPVSAEPPVSEESASASPVAQWPVVSERDGHRLRLGWALPGC